MSLEPKKAPYFFRNFLIISIDLFKALEYFTEKKLVHRDIKRKQYLPYSGFVCEVLICANSERYHGLADFTSTVMLIPWLQLSYCCTCHNPMSCDLINICLFTITSRE